MGPNSGLIWPAPSIKIEVQTHFDSIWLYPFSWMFSLWLYFYFCQVAIFWLKKVQFSSQKCNFYLWKILHCNFWKQERKKITQNNKNATLPLYVFCLSNTERIFCRLVLISVSPHPNLLFIETEIRMIHAKKSFLLKKVDFPLLQFPSQRKKKKIVKLNGY